MALKEKVRRRVGARKELQPDGSYHITRFEGPTDPAGRAAAGRFTESMATRSRSESSMTRRAKVVEAAFVVRLYQHLRNAGRGDGGDRGRSQRGHHGCRLRAVKLRSRGGGKQNALVPLNRLTGLRPARYYCRSLRRGEASDGNRTATIAAKVLETVDAGLCSGVGKPVPGEMCVEAAVCYALGLPHSDNPDCVAPALSRFQKSS